VKIKRGKTLEWKKYLDKHQTGYDRTVVMLAETIAELIEKKRNNFCRFEFSMLSSLIEAIHLCGIRTDNPDLADAMISESFDLLTAYWETGWILSEFSFKDKNLYHSSRILWTLK
jgi:hypothetical protein